MDMSVPGMGDNMKRQYGREIVAAICQADAFLLRVQVLGAALPTVLHPMACRGRRACVAQRCMGRPPPELPPPCHFCSLFAVPTKHGSPSPLRFLAHLQAGQVNTEDFQLDTSGMCKQVRTTACWLNCNWRGRYQP